MDLSICELSELPGDWCACIRHRAPEPEPSGSISLTRRRYDNKACHACGEPLFQGSTREGVYCSWECSYMEAP